MFYLARHDDILAVCRDSETFRQGTFIPFGDDPRSADELQLNETDPPVHTEIRRIFNAHVGQSAVRRHRPVVEQICHDLVDRLMATDRADLVRDYAAPLPALVVARLLGLDDQQAHRLRSYSAAFLDTVDIGTEVDAASFARERAGQFEHEMRELIRDRMNATEQPDDLVTALVNHRTADGAALSETKILTHVAKDLISAGVETTTHVLGNFFYDVLSTPGCLAWLRDDLSRVTLAIEESLRYRAPVQLLFRRAARDVEINGTPIPAGSKIALGYASANHDETVFTCPERFDPDRGDEVRRHLGFGWGIHACVGAPLARLELVTAAETLIARAPDLCLAAEQSYERVRFFMMRGPRELRVLL
jgi:cytochrome P450